MESFVVLVIRMWVWKLERHFWQSHGQVAQIKVSCLNLWWMMILALYNNSGKGTNRFVLGATFLYSVHFWHFLGSLYIPCVEERTTPTCWMLFSWQYILKIEWLIVHQGCTDVYPGCKTWKVILGFQVFQTNKQTNKQSRREYTKKVAQTAVFYMLLERDWGFNRVLIATPFGFRILASLVEIRNEWFKDNSLLLDLADWLWWIFCNSSKNEYYSEQKNDSTQNTGWQLTLPNRSDWKCLPFCGLRIIRRLIILCSLHLTLPITSTLWPMWGYAQRMKSILFLVSPFGQEERIHDP